MISPLCIYFTCEKRSQLGVYHMIYFSTTGLNSKKRKRKSRNKPSKTQRRLRREAKQMVANMDFPDFTTLEEYLIGDDLDQELVFKGISA